MQSCCRAGITVQVLRSEVGATPLVGAGPGDGLLPEFPLGARGGVTETLAPFKKKKKKKKTMVRTCWNRSWAFLGQLPWPRGREYIQQLSMA